MSSSSALVLFSGGQDSTTCLAWALDRYPRVETVGFDYGQRHHVELDCRLPLRRALVALRPDWEPRLGQDHVLKLDALGEISQTALTREAEIHFDQDGLPSTFVPGRNLLFFTYAAALAYRREIRVLVGGMCETDYSGYPDCRNNTLKALEATLQLGMARPFVLETPLMERDKAATFQLACEIGGPALLELIISETHSCYRGERSVRHPWGRGCGHCPACDLRAAGWERFRASGQD